jgi:hypothetical protein
LERVQERWPEDLKDEINSNWFKRALNILIEESARTVDEEHARMLGRVAAHGCFPTGHDQHRQEDLASYIRDIAQLGKDDIQMLKLLGIVYKTAVRPSPGKCESFSFRAGFERFRARFSTRRLPMTRSHFARD